MDLLIFFFFFRDKTIWKMADKENFEEEVLSSSEQLAFVRKISFRIIWPGEINCEAEQKLYLTMGRWWGLVARNARASLRKSSPSRLTYQTTQQVMIRPFSQSDVPHVAHNDVLRHVRRAVENDVFVAPSANISGLIARNSPNPKEWDNGGFANFPFRR